MEYLELKSAQHILNIVANNDGQFGWYNIVRYVDNRNDSEKTPSSFQVLKELTSNEFLQEEKSAENNSKYFITQKGRQKLAELQSEKSNE